MTLVVDYQRRKECKEFYENACTGAGCSVTATIQTSNSFLLLISHRVLLRWLCDCPAWQSFGRFYDHRHTQRALGVAADRRLDNDACR